jgi:uncharacterized protein (DUF1800 family)
MLHGLAHRPSHWRFPLRGLLSTPNTPRSFWRKQSPSGSGVQDGETVLDLIANHVGTARYISRRLCRRLIGDAPPESIVQAAADVFHSQRAASDQLKQVVRTILLSSEFSTTWGEKIKRPFEYTVSLLRASDANFAWSDSFRYRYEAMGQALFNWRPPDGYPDYKENWSSTMPMLQSWRMCNWLLDGWKVGGRRRGQGQPAHRL